MLRKSIFYKFLILLTIVLLINVSLSQNRKGMLFADTLDAQDEKAKELFNKGIQSYIDGKREKAFEYLEQAVSARPSADTIAFLLSQVDPSLFIAMMREGGDLRDTVIRLHEMAKVSDVEEKMSESDIQALISQLRNEEILKIHEVISRILLIGDPAIPYLVKELANDKNENIRMNSIRTLVRMGNIAVMPMIEAVNSKNILVKQAAISILGELKDERAVPTLKAIYTSKDETSDITYAAAKATEKIMSVSPDDLPAPEILYYDLARKYYKGNPYTLKSFKKSNYIWRWSTKNDELTKLPIYTFNYNYQLAEEVCFDALDLNPNYEKVWPLLINIFLAEFSQMELAYEELKSELKVGETTQEVLDKMKTDVDIKRDELISLFSANKIYMYNALALAMEDDNVRVAVKCINMLTPYASPLDLPLPVEDYTSVFSDEKVNLDDQLFVAESNAKIGAPLVNALINRDKRIRYAASVAIVKLKPKEKFLHAEDVILNLSEALNETGRRIVLMATSNQETLNSMKNSLEKLNCYVKVALDSDNTILSSRSVPKSDLIILDFRLAQKVVFTGPESTFNKENAKIELSLYDSLKTDKRTSMIPIFIICKDEVDYELAKSLYGSEVISYLIYPVKIDLLSSELNKVFSNEDFIELSRLRSQKIGEMAATALASIDVNDTALPYIEAYNHLKKAALDSPEFIKLPSIKALGNFAQADSIDLLFKILLNKEDNTNAVIVETAKAIAKVAEKNNLILTDQNYKILLNIYDEKNPDLQQAAIEAIGKFRISNEMRFELLKIKRVDTIK